MSKSQTTKAYEFIRNEIFSGQFRPGGRLREVEMARAIGVSRTPVREAFRLLESEGLVQQKPNSGTSVRTANEGEVLYVLELREALESFAVVRAVARISERDLALMERLCEQMHRIAHAVKIHGVRAWDGITVQRWQRADFGIHALILRACGNPLITRIADDMHLLSAVVRPVRPEDAYSVPLSDAARLWKNHYRIARAIRRRDARAARQAVIYHYESSRRRMGVLPTPAQQAESAAPKSVGPDQPAKPLDAWEEEMELDRLVDLLAKSTREETA